jgi:Pentapeptide repeats (8 copies)
MSKRWAAWPPGIRWLVGIAAVVLAAAIVWALFVPVPDWLARHDVGLPKPALLQTARDAAQGRLLTLGAGLLAAGALVFTARNFTLSRRTFELTEQGQVTDRYTKAIEQLGSDKLDVRIGGIYALERVARDSAKDHPTVMEVLTAFIREHSREPWPPPDPGVQVGARSTRPDVQAAITVVGRRGAEQDIQLMDLGGADLGGADLTGAHLGLALLTGAHLGGADLTGASPVGADLGGATLSARASAARTSPARTSPARTSPVPGGLKMCQFQAAGN